MTDLNALARGQAPSEGGYQQHPIGTYTGVVEDILQKTVGDGNDEKPVWEVKIRTDAALARHTIWGFSTNDMKAIDQNQDDRDKALTKIGYTKKLFCDLGVWPAQIAEGAAWDGPTPSILGDMQHLKGKLCQIKVEKSKKKEGEVVIWVNAPVDGAEAPAQGTQQASQQQQHVGHQAPAQQQGSAAGSVGGLDDIPF